MPGIVMPAVQSFLFSTITYVLIFSGLAFVNGRFFPDKLAPVYDHTSYFVRLLIFSFIISLAANYTMFRAFQVTGASLAGPLLVIAFVLISVVNTVLLDHVRLNVPIILTAGVAVMSCGLLSWLLVKAAG